MMNFAKPSSKITEIDRGNVRGSGLVSGTRVATTIGWRPVEAVIPGDEVLTFDEGLKPVTRVVRSVLWPNPKSCPRHLCPLQVSAEALGNHADMLLLPEQLVMLESDIAEQIFGDPFSLLPAQALDGFRGIVRVKPETRIEVVSICFESDQVVFANIGALFFCPKVLCGEVRPDLLDEDDSPYLPLSLTEAETLTEIIAADEDQDRVN